MVDELEPDDVWSEVRVLGPLRAWSWRGRGEVLGERAWGTAKNADLLRLVALAEGRSVPDEVLLEELWPGADESRARASLRTATSSLRKLLGPDVLVRTPTGMALTTAWVDASSFRVLAAEVSRHLRAGRPVDAVVAAREALALYLGDLVPSSGSPALAEAARALADQRRECLEDAAEAAVQAGWVRDAVQLARQARDLDPLSERASRSLMLGWWGLGEAALALREYERCRRALDDELGAVPSPQTRAVHQQVLGAPPSRVPGTALVGRADAVAWLRAVLEGRRGAATTGATVRAVLAGVEGSGRRAVVRAACAADGISVVEVEDGAAAARATAAGREDVVLWEPRSGRDRPVLERLLVGGGADDAADGAGRPPRGQPPPDHAQPLPEGEPAAARSPSRPRAALVLLAPAPGGEPDGGADAVAGRELWRGLAFGADVQALDLAPLLEDEVARLVADLVGAEAGPALVEELVRRTGGAPGRVVAQVRQLTASGRLVLTRSGLALAPASSAEDDDARRTAAAALAVLDGDPLEALLLAAVLDRTVTPELLAPLLGGTDDQRSPRTAVDRAAAALGHLVERNLLEPTPAGVAWRHPLLRDAVYAWVRPTARARLHRRVAGQAAVSGTERVRHWLGAGEPRLACSAALVAAQDSAASGDLPAALRHLLAVRTLVSPLEEQGRDAAELLELMGDVCTGLRHLEQAQEAYGSALAVARRHLLPSVDRLRRKAHGAGDPLALGSGNVGAAEAPLTVLAGLDGLRTGAPLDLVDVVDDAVDRARRAQDGRGLARALLLRAGAVDLPRRRFRALHEDVEAALAAGASPHDQLRAGLLRCTGQVLLGGGHRVAGDLASVARAVAEAGDPALRARTTALRALAAHDVDAPEADDLLDRVEETATTGALGELSVEAAATAVRVLVERGELSRAEVLSRYLRSPSAPPRPPLLEQLAAVAEAGLAEATGDHRRAVDGLLSVVEEGRATGCLLLVPEAATRLAVLVAPEDLDEALRHFDLADALAGPVWSERESFWRLMARGAVRAVRGDVDGAARVHRQAAHLASANGLHVLAARARAVTAWGVPGGAAAGRRPPAGGDAGGPRW
ncbi:BTAD domain-containing putative transcriptional regulator [Pseudokineococcus sp. 5B2Z-1]|uniref:BTAD domain-containing putative transcriptional regulator n=1 Tax=Pseudokineococcus sp. 5B2Z-1 TaxID=3132744 RepID=UPI003099538C